MSRRHHRTPTRHPPPLSAAARTQTEPAPFPFALSPAADTSGGGRLPVAGTCRPATSPSSTCAPSITSTRATSSRPRRSSCPSRPWRPSAAATAPSRRGDIGRLRTCHVSCLLFWMELWRPLRGCVRRAKAAGRGDGTTGGWRGEPPPPVWSTHTPHYSGACSVSVSGGG